MAVANDDYVGGAPNRPCGYAQYATQLTAAINLETTPTTGKKLAAQGSGGATKGLPNRALIQCEAQDVRWTDDPDVDPTSTIGMLLKANTVLDYSGDLSLLRFIQTAATAILNVSYYNS